SLKFRGAEEAVRGRRNYDSVSVHKLRPRIAATSCALQKTKSPRPIEKIAPRGRFTCDVATCKFITSARATVHSPRRLPLRRSEPPLAVGRASFACIGSKFVPELAGDRLMLLVESFAIVGVFAHPHFGAMTQ